MKSRCDTMQYEEDKHMGETSYEVRKRWLDKAYKRYTFNLRYDTDQHLIDFMEDNRESMGTTNIIRDALEMYIEAQK